MAVFAVYLAGYAHTESAAERFSARVAERRPAYHPQAPQVAAVPPAVLPPVKSAEPEPADAKAAAPLQAAAKATEKKAAPKPEAKAEVTPDANAAEPTPAPQPDPVVAAVAAAPVAPVPVAPAAPTAEPVFQGVVPQVPAPQAQPAPRASIWKDGTYTGWGYSRHGDIEAQVVVENGRITSANISQCRTRYSCNVISRLPPQVVERQSPDVDYVSGATQSADAFYGAVASALNKAK